MTQTLGMHERVTPFDRTQTSGTPASSTASARSTVGRFGTFAITFGIAFAILYAVLEQLNWPLFTYHPAVGKLDLGMQPPRRGEGPPMYWYGWLALAFGGAAVAGFVATMVSSRGLLRATIFCCVLAALWPAIFALLVFTADRVSFDAEFLKSIWLAAIPAFVVAAGAAYWSPSEWAQRLWAAWLLIMPIGGLAILAYSLKSFFLR